MLRVATKWTERSLLTWTSVLGLLCPAVTTLALSAGAGCSLDAECVSGERRCTNGSVLEECTPHPSGIDVSRDSVSVGHHDRSPNTWELSATCGAGLCKTEPSKDSYGVSKQNAFCTLSPTPDPVCAGGLESACDGTTSVECHGGFEVAATSCASCVSGFSGCKGDLDDTCATTTDCATGFECSPGGRCQMACACPEGARCGTCDVAERETVGPSRGTPWVFVCAAGRCARKYD